MENYKIKVRIGDNEFEAEGPSDLVKEQFQSFRDLIASIPPKQDIPIAQATQQNQQIQSLNDEVSQPVYDKIYKADGRVISLTALPSTLPEAVLLILFGQRYYRKNDAVTGSEIMDGLKQSGYKADRIDRQMDKFVTEGLVISIGAGRGTRYRLTNQGLLKAQSVAKDLIATVP